MPFAATLMTITAAPRPISQNTSLRNPLLTIENQITAIANIQGMLVSPTRLDGVSVQYSTPRRAVYSEPT